MSEFIDYFDGLMLGDGSLTKNESAINYYYTHSSKTLNKEWLEFIKERFELEGIISKISLGRKPGKYFHKGWGGFINSSGDYILYSHSYDFFTEQEKRWYIKDYNIDEYNIRRWHEDEDEEWYARRKIIPKDVKLTPECVANWYMGDGTISRSASSYNQIQIATNSFAKEEVEFICSLLEDQVVEEAHIFLTCGKYTIRIYKKSSSYAFLDYIRPYIKQVKCFNYKIPEVKCE